MFEFLRVKSRGSLLVQAGQMVRLRVRVGFGTWFGVLFDLVFFGSACAIHTVCRVNRKLTRDPVRHSCTLATSRFSNDTTTSHFKLALHRNIQVVFSKTWNGWNRRTHGNSST
ncbi:hypothetical protein HanHA300_Chr07g0253051 [Helianthus annuus]|nr:hypothetical protein HanHA300_Chr07g0253051 [Helianthus annuus]KAJ0729376.1 hypothetical protein HanLR1_Chr07g0252201 [Helianthus annuus]